MADDEGTDVDITHDVFLIHTNEPKEDKEFALLKLKPLLEGQNLKVLVDEEDFKAGEPVFFKYGQSCHTIKEVFDCIDETLQGKSMVFTGTATGSREISPTSLHVGRCFAKRKFF